MGKSCRDPIRPLVVFFYSPGDWLALPPANPVYLQLMEQVMSCRIVVVLLVVVGLLSLEGCAHRLPPVVPAHGTVLLNGKPLPNASVTFVPMLEYFGAESNSTAVTDENGQFTLTCAYKNQPGAVVGTHVVLVTDPPLPDDLRKEQDSRVRNDYRAKLGNRPIPSDYSSVSKSPIKIEVKESQSEYKIELTRQE
jgi:hypothetical protein